MPELDSADLPVRTVLEQQIRQRQQTFEEFAEYAETFAREHNEPGTLSVRHLQRLVAGARPGGRPLGPVRPATARLLERIFSLSIGELLMPTGQAPTGHPLRVAVAVVVKGNEVLIVCRREVDPGGICWQFPAGMVKPGATSKTVAVRETLAETGAHCVVASALGSRLHPITKVVCDYMLCDYMTGDIINADIIENVDTIWVQKSDLTRFIPIDQIYKPVLDALGLT